MILYEYPFNERLRTYLRLEQLFRRLGELIPRAHPLDHHYALVTIFEIMDVAARADLKSDVLKDLEKNKQQLDSYRGNPSISQDVLDSVISQIDHCFTSLNAQHGKAGHALSENDWLMSIRSRVGIPGGTCGFDLPAYYAWQHHAPEQRQQDLEGWTSHLAPLAESVFVLAQDAARFGHAAKGGGRPRPVPADPAAGAHLPAAAAAYRPRPGTHPGDQRQPADRFRTPHAPGRHRQLQSSTDDAAFELTLCA